MARGTLGRLLLGVVAVAAGGCILDYDSLTRGAVDAGAPSSRDEDGGTNADGGVDAGRFSSSPCVHIAATAGSFCIEATEVSRRQYAAFLAGSDGGAGPSPACGWKTSHVPDAGPGSWPPSAAQLDLPVVGVDWCDAYAYCAWVGRHLCGAIAGGALPYGKVDEPGADAWFVACSHDGSSAFPYGPTFDETRCIDSSASLSRGEPAPVGTSTCGGGYAGISDMSGNVREWIDACDGTSQGTDGCYHRGGSYELGPASARSLMCQSMGPDLGTEYRSWRDETLGFRCCGE